MLCFFFFNDTATTEIYTLSLHDALPICGPPPAFENFSRQRFAGRNAPSHRGKVEAPCGRLRFPQHGGVKRDRKSTRLNSSHGYISYAVFCLKKKKKDIRITDTCSYAIYS